MVIRPRGVRPLPQSGHDDTGGGPADLPPVPEHPESTLSGREPAQWTRRLHPPRAVLHIALVVESLATYQELRKHTVLLAPRDWEGTVKAHFLLRRKGQTDDDLTLKFALTELGLTDPAVAQLQYPETLELGWTDEPT